MNKINLKLYAKNFFVKTKTLIVLDRLNFLFTRLKYASKNRKFTKTYPDFKLPHDYYLYETYKLDYSNYKESGTDVAKEIIEWTSTYMQNPTKILEWGCGVARIIRHLHNYTGKNVQIYGVDINQEMIDWDIANIKNISFSKTDYYPPMPFDDNQFEMIYAISVLTHIEAHVQEKWLQEINRIATKDGIFLFTTNGKQKESYLNENDKYSLANDGSLTIDYKQKGHRMMGTYNQYESFSQFVNKYFDILEYYDAEKFPEKTGGQDLWIVRKRS